MVRILEAGVAGPGRWFSSLGYRIFCSLPRAYIKRGTVTRSARPLSIDFHIRPAVGTMWKVTTLLCAVAAVAIAQDGLSRDKYAFYEDHTNDVFDQILESVRKSEKLDPLKLPEQVSKFDKKVLVRFHGEAKLYNGTLTGISTIHRTGNSRFNMTEYGIDVFADVALGALDVNYKAHIKFMGKGPTVDMHVHIAYVRLLAEVAQGKESEMALKQFKVLRLDGFKLKINGLGPLSAIFNFFTKHFTNLFKNQVKNKVEKVIRGTLIKKIKELKLAF